MVWPLQLLLLRLLQWQPLLRLLRVWQHWRRQPLPMWLKLWQGKRRPLLLLLHLMRRLKQSLPLWLRWRQGKRRPLLLLLLLLLLPMRRLRQPLPLWLRRRQLLGHEHGGVSGWNASRLEDVLPVVSHPILCLLDLQAETRRVTRVRGALLLCSGTQLMHNRFAKATAAGIAAGRGCAARLRTPQLPT